MLDRRQHLAERLEVHLMRFERFLVALPENTGPWLLRCFPHFESYLLMFPGLVLAFFMGAGLLCAPGILLGWVAGWLYERMNPQSSGDADRR